VLYTVAVVPAVAKTGLAFSSCLSRPMALSSGNPGIPGIPGIGKPHGGPGIMTQARRTGDTGDLHSSLHWPPLQLALEKEKKIING
jgi:hypothetical protein